MQQKFSAKLKPQHPGWIEAQTDNFVQLELDVVAIIGSAYLPAGRQVQALVSADEILTDNSASNHL